MRLVSGPCSETQPSARSDRTTGEVVRMDATPSAYPAVPRHVPHNAKRPGGSAGEVGRAVPPSDASGPFQAVVQFVHLGAPGSRGPRGHGMRRPEAVFVGVSADSAASPPKPTRRA